MTKFMRRIAILLCICLMAPTVLNCIPNVNVNTTAVADAAAKTKAKLYAKKGTIGIASTPEYIYIEDQNYDAKYTYTSSNKKIVTVDKNGKLTGVAKGTAKITVKETYKKKTVTVGTFTVSVVNSKLSSKSIEVPLFASYDLPLEYKYKNFKAKYTGESADPTIAIVDTDGKLVGLKEGVTTITVSETYKKNTRKLGKLTVTVKAPSISPDTTKVTLGINQTNDPFSLITIENYYWDAGYSFESADPTIVSVNQVTEDGYTYPTLKGEKIGSTTITVYSEYKGEKVIVGTVEITVAEIPVTSFGFDPWYKDDNNTFTKTFYIGDDDNYMNYYLDKEPYNTTTPVTYTSSDPSIATVDADGKVNALKEGTVEITATCGTFSDKAVITIESY